MVGRGGAGRGRGGRGGSHGAPLPRSIVISKKISYVLRHGAAKEGLKLDEAGYINCAELLAWQPLHSLKLTFPELRQIVTSNDKQRFQLIPIPSAATNASLDSETSPSNSPPSPEDPSTYLIRASQGHTIPIASASLLTPILPSDPDFPAKVVHGTYPAAWKKILTSGGLSRMGRQHVHFTFALGKTYTVKSGKAKDLDRQGGDGAEGSSTREGEEIVEEEVEERKVISGMRSSASVFVWVDVRRSIEEGGLKWWRSANGVVLTEGDERGFVRLKWIKRVVQEGKGVIWRGEEEEGRVEKGKEKSVRSQ